jgi:hypothetical protein
MTSEQLIVLQIKRDECYTESDKARERQDWDTCAHYYSMAMGISGAISALQTLAIPSPARIETS